MSSTRVVIILGFLVICSAFTAGDLAVTKNANQTMVTLGGQVIGPGPKPMQGVTVLMFEVLASGPVVVATATTDADGNYSVFVQAKCTTYQMLPVLDGYSSSGSSISGCITGDNFGMNGSLSTSDPRGNVGKQCPIQIVGDPVDVTTGNMYLEQSDYREADRWPSLRLIRSYNSLSAAITAPGLFGSGWTTEFEQSIAITNDNQIRLFESDGQATYFTRSGGAGPFLPVTGDVHAQIVKNGDSSYTLTYKDGNVLQFSAMGKLLSMADRNNNQLTLTYGANGVLTTLTDPFGRSLNVITNSSQRVSTISDSTGTIATYTYDSSNSKLTSVSYADGSKFTYAYAGTDLTTVTDKLGNIIESHTYDGNHRALTSERHGGVLKYTLNYATPTRTDVTDGLGRLTKYFFHSIRGRNRVNKIEGWIRRA